MDFTHGSMVNGRKFRTLNLMDGYTREALTIEVDMSLPGSRVCGYWSSSSKSVEWPPGSS
jgi:hypothetical protein